MTSSTTSIRLARALDRLTDAQREVLLIGATLQGERRDLVAELLMKLWPRNENQPMGAPLARPRPTSGPNVSKPARASQPGLARC
jgi:hypothetical protein